MDRGYVAVHVAEEGDHWWFRGRRAILLAALRHALPARPLRLLELGCGSGNVLEALGALGEAVGMEPDPELVAAGRARGLDVRRGSLPDDRVVPAGWPDAVLFLDVLEHLEDDLRALRAAWAIVRPGGTLVVTVPAYAWLWSPHDEVLGHSRRYTAASLGAVVTRAGFRLRHVTYFNTLLLPAIVAARAWKRLRGAGHDLSRPAAPVNAALARVFSLERFVVARWRVPAGASLLLIADR